MYDSLHPGAPSKQLKNCFLPHGLNVLTKSRAYPVGFFLIAGPLQILKLPNNYSIIFQKLINSSDMLKTAAAMTGAS